jgi:hypothetical protein
MQDQGTTVHLARASGFLLIHPTATSQAFQQGLAYS